MNNQIFPSKITKTCLSCIMDDSDPEIEFDNDGICNHCKNSLKKLNTKPYSLSTKEKDREFLSLINKIKINGKGKNYDCVIGLSGGVDSSYVAYILKNAGLRCLAVHLDNGWNSELAVMNIENICRNLNIDLKTKVLDWEEFKNLQISFLKSSTPDSEIPTDHAIFATLFETAAKFGIKYILTGSNLASESILPLTWSYGHWDWKYIKNINSKFGNNKLKKYPHFSIIKLLYYLLLKRIKLVSTLNYVSYDKELAKIKIKEQLGWRDYGGKHHESLYTKFFQIYILPKKFNIDKRKAHYSSLICAGQLSREDAMTFLKLPLGAEEELLNEKEYLEKKLNLEKKEFETIMNLEPKSFYDYINNYNLILKIQKIRNFFTKKND